MAKRAESEARGLPSLGRSRADRARAIRTGKARLAGPLPRYTWLWLGLVVTAILVVYWRVSESELTEVKSQVMAQQRQIEQTLGGQLRPFLEKTETWTQQLASAPPEPAANAPVLADVRTSPGVYLRLPISAASSSEEIRLAAGRSLHDGFTSCFFVTPEDTPAASAPTQACEKTKDCPDGYTCTSRGICDDLCYQASDCAEGLLCDETHHCAVPVEPYNMRRAYSAYRVLSPKWGDELQMAPDEITVRLFRNDLEKVTAIDVPIGVKLLERAKYFTLILDEEPEGGLPEPLPKLRSSDGEESVDSRIQRVPHWARVGVWDLASGDLVFRDRLRADGGQVTHLGPHRLSPHKAAARDSQVNSCALALEIRDRIDSADVPGTDAETQAGTGAEPGAEPRDRGGP